MREFFQGIVDQVGGRWQGLARPVQLVIMLGIIAGIIALVVVGSCFQVKTGVPHLQEKIDLLDLHHPGRPLILLFRWNLALHCLVHRHLGAC
jgi:hypothetical protein